MLVEQAIFTSIRSTRNDGYQLSAASPGVSEQQRRELTKWGPAHDSLDEGKTAAVSFFTMQDGHCCIARTSFAGAEYSGRGGERVYTQFLILPPALLQRFANHPFRVMEAVLASGRVRVLDPIPKQLEPFRLVGRASPANTSVLSLLCGELGADRLSVMVSAAISTMQLAVITPVATETLFSAVLDLLPPPCRVEFSFTTGLRHSPRRPFRWIAPVLDAESKRRVQRMQQITLVDLTGDLPTRFLPEYGWPLLVHELLKASRFTEIQHALRYAQNAPQDNFDELAERLRQQIQQGEEIEDPKLSKRPPSVETAGRDNGYRADPTKLRDGIAH